MPTSVPFQEKCLDRMFPSPVRSKANTQGSTTKGGKKYTKDHRANAVDLVYGNVMDLVPEKEKEKGRGGSKLQDVPRRCTHDCSDPTVLLSSHLSHVPSAE